MVKPGEYLSIGEAAQRTGVAASTLRFYEEKGLISAHRSAGNQRSYPRAMLRKISVIRIAQTLGFTLREIGQALESLPDGRNPTARDWEKLSRHWQVALDARIDNLQKLRDQLSACIGCGCLSMKKCALYNPGDCVAERGNGPRFLLEE